MDIREIIFYLSKFEFVFYLFILSILFILLSFLLKNNNLKKINLILFSILLSLSILEFVFCITCNPILIKGRHEHLYQLDNLELKKVRHLKIFEGIDKMFLENSNDDIDIFKKDKTKIIFDSHIQMYDNTFRYTKGNNKSDTSIVFLGCSFTYGHGLNDDQTLPYYFSKEYDFNINVLNCALGGMGINTAYNVINSGVLNKLLINKNSKVKYFIYSLINDHIERAFRSSGFNLSDDNYLLDNNKFVRVKEPFGILKTIFKKSYIFNKYLVNIINDKNKGFHEQYFIDRIMKIRDLALERYNAELIVVAWPEVEQKIIERLEEENINLIILDKKFNNDKYKIKNDGHPNEKANKEIAQILFDYINNNK